MRWALLVVAACSGTDKPLPQKPSDAPNAIAVEAKYEVETEDVEIDAGSHTFEGTITAPKAPGKWPAILLHAGSGPTDRDWNSMLIPTKNGSGALLANELSKHGAVVLRFDKLGTGKNVPKPGEELTLDRYRDDAYAALDVLRKRPNVRPEAIYLAGHSEGGLHVTRLAQIQKVAGIVYLSSLSRPEGETMLAQLEKQLHNPSAMLSDKAIDQEMDGLRTAFADFIAGKPVDPQKAARIPKLQQLVQSVINPATASLMKPLLAFDNAAEAAKLTGPFFVFAGGKDLQIDLERDAKHLEKSLRDAGRDVTFHLSPDADHVLKHETKTLEQLRADPLTAQNSYNADGRVLDEDFVKALVDWLATRTSGSRLP
jgi:pimeloyl-ACP methyl ester carboxylesterase